jgi:uncharacterized membrane protein YkoI
MRTRSALFITAGVVGAGIGGAAIGAAVNDPDVYVDPVVMTGVAAPSDTAARTTDTASSPSSSAADQVPAAGDVTVRAVEGLDQLVGILQPDDDSDDWYVSGVDVDFGPEAWIAAAPVFEDYDGDGTAEPLLTELRGLQGQEVTIGVRYDGDGDRDDAYAFTIQGLPFRDPAGGAAPWQTPVAGAQASQDDIAAAAAAAVGSGATVLDIDREVDDGWTGWDVDVRSSDGRDYDVYVDLTGAVLDVRADSSSASDTSGSPNSSAPAAAGSVSAEQAADIGAAATGGEAIDVWPGTEGGRSVYYVDVRTADGLVEVYVDAITGEVLQIEPGD